MSIPVLNVITWTAVGIAAIVFYGGCILAMIKLHKLIKKYPRR